VLVHEGRRPIEIARLQRFATDYALVHRQPLRVRAAANRRRTFVRRCARLDVFRRKCQVVRARFDGDGHTRASRSVDSRKRRCGGEMDDVDVNAVLAREADEKVDGGVLGFRRAALQPRRIAPRISAGLEQTRW
jgi:hypothetical protein